MAEQRAFDPKTIELQPNSQFISMLEQFNLPPAFIAYVRRNQRAMLGGLIVVLVLILAVASMATYRQYRAAKAASALDVAQIAKEDKRRLLEAVIDTYASTASGQWARVELALLDEQEGKPADAISRLEAIRAELSEQSSLWPLVTNKLAVLQEKQKQWDGALSLYRQLAGHENFAADAHLAMGRVNEAKGDVAAARTDYGRYLELLGQQAGTKNPDPNREMIQSRLNHLK